MPHHKTRPPGSSPNGALTVRVQTIAVLIASCLTLSAATAHAQGVAPLDSARLEQARVQQTQLRHARQMKIAGIVLTSIGATMGIVTVVGLAISANAATSSTHQDEPFQIGAGIALYCGSIAGATLVAGIPLWVIGAKREIRLKLKLGPTAAGATASVGFAF